MSVDVAHLIANGSGEEIADAIVDLSRASDDDSLKQLTEFLRIRESHTYFKHAIPKLASLGLLARGVPGVEALRLVFADAPGSIYPTAILSVLWRASTSRSFDLPGLNYLPATPSLHVAPNQEVQAAAGRAVRAIVAEATTNIDVFQTLVNFLQQQVFMESRNPDDTANAELLRLLADATLKISPSVLEQYSGLIAEDHNEETYHKFLARHPVFLDPLAHSVSKQPLGVEFITDFVVRRLDDKYLLVEIEKPQDKIFTKQDDLTSQFSHALGQVLDFQSWVTDNLAYAQKHLPQIALPRGLLVMGRRTDLTSKQARKLHQLNMSLSTIELATFDDLLTSTTRLYENAYQNSG